MNERLNNNIEQLRKELFNAKAELNSIMFNACLDEDYSADESIIESMKRVILIQDAIIDNFELIAFNFPNTISRDINFSLLDDRKEIIEQKGKD